jgi:hypothetical protein
MCFVTTIHYDLIASMKSVFCDQDNIPSEVELKLALADTFILWQQIENFTLLQCPTTKAGWYFSGTKYGWGYRISDATRVLVYLLPRSGYFKVGLVFGKKALTVIQNSKVANSIKQELSTTKAFAEGTGIRLNITDASILSDILLLITIKVAN